MNKIFALIFMLLSTWLSVAHAEGNYVSQGGLIWMPMDDSRKTWSEANSFCTNTAIDGQKGWRLPTIDESRVMAETKAMQRILGETWSSTPGDTDWVPGRSDYHRYASMGYNWRVGTSWDSEDKYVTCVHSPYTPSSNQPPTPPKKIPAPKAEPVPKINIIVDDSSEQRAARERTKAAAKAEQEHKQQVAAELAARKAKEAKEAAAAAAREEKQHQWCMADQSRLSLCSCSKWASHTGSACGM